jgi:hypothetical protein
LKIRRLLLHSLAGLSIVIGTTNIALAQESSADARTLVATVRSATERFKNIDAAKAAGYALFHGCVSGQQEGAMGIHYANGDLVGDGTLDAQHPEALLYEFRNGRYELLGVEYVVLAEGWNANHKTPPVLGGQLFNLNSSPNRYGLPAFYELHVWAWKTNPRGTFADFNPSVTCDGFTLPDAAGAAMHSH